MDHEFVYVGQVDLVVPPEDREQVLEVLSHLKPKCVPVFLNKSIQELSNIVFCSRVLFGIFHNVLCINSQTMSSEDQENAYKAYSEANEEFSNVIKYNFQDGDIVWIHDYHLLLLPSFINRTGKSLIIVS